MADRDWPKELEQARQEARDAWAQVSRLENAVRIAAKSHGLTEVEVNQLISLARGRN